MGSLDHHLLNADSPDIALVVATPAERIESIRANGLSWKGPLTMEQYIAREDFLIQQDMVKDGWMTCWVLVDRRLRPDERPILSSCESIAKRAFLAYKGNIETVITHGIGSVFCPPEHRGRGYAKRMIIELSKILDTWQQERGAGQGHPQCLFSVLYSDIGKSFYAAHGWHPYASSHFTLAPEAVGTAAVNGSANGNGNSSGNNGSVRITKGVDMSIVKDMSREDVLRYMCSEPVMEQHKQKLKDASKVSSKAIAAFPPDFAHMSWHWARDEFYSQILRPEKGETHVKGAAVPSRKVFMTWNRKYGATPKDCTLYILRTQHEEPSSPAERQGVVEALAAILRRARVEAHEWNVDHVQIWNPSALVKEAIQIADPDAAEVHREKDSIPCLKWDGDKFGYGENVDWMWNERYGWC
ncbi:conserved hypothetical protein [Trichophyton verrucosum HKI 0517]|uniref:LYC1 C-terminal domain-containing protein n=1 Tax=Trichophyton verrucosum (strain HKI 0517) TaxID=663202 RepID=D4D6F4_TRIVH|nr:uncharacterized protein TRV_02679 [Trichophyton verrucosum HKI 0517]EFE42598.1 conserved hypothetical protein [Trichophyton verrucosum HKI 0517]